MSKARDLANLLDSNGDVTTGALDNVPPSNDASALTTGTLSADRIPAVYTNSLKAEIKNIAMRLTSEKFNTPNLFVDTYADTSGLDTAASTSEFNTGGYVTGKIAVSGASQTFSYTGSLQSWSIPDGVNTVTARCWGAGGGSDYSNNRGGHGAAVVADIDVSGLSALYVVVGRGGAAVTTGGDGGGGGGFSGVFSSNTLNQSNALVIAGGGGGAGDGSSTAGGDAGASNGNKDGGNGNQASSTTHVGKGGTQTAAGAAGNNGVGSGYWDNCNGFGASTPSGALIGGDAGYTCSSEGARSWNPPTKPSIEQGGGGRGGFEPGGSVGGGGGGGGYYGGGGGSAGSWSDGGAGGGAGSSYAKSGSTSNVTFYSAQSLTSGAGYNSSADGTGSPATAGSGENGTVYLEYPSVNIANDLTLISQTQTTDSVPTNGYMTILIEDASGTATLNTDIKGYVSRDGGTTYTQGTLVSDGNWGSSTKKSLRFDAVDISGQPTGTSMKYKITTHNQGINKETRIHAVTLGWD
jgi:hypothetical protein